MYELTSWRITNVQYFTSLAHLSAHALLLNFYFILLDHQLCGAK